MTFTPNIPTTGQSLGVTKDPIKNNFTNYNNLVSVDHVAPNAAGQGQHKQVTLNTFVTFPGVASGNESYIGSFNASTAGSQLVYRPSVVTTGQVPCTPRSMARINSNGTGTYTLGAGYSFNVQSPQSISTNTFKYKFASTLATTDYFIVATVENSTGTDIIISNKTATDFTFSNTSLPNNSAVTIIVY